VSSELALLLVGALVVSRLVALGLRGGAGGAAPYAALLLADLGALGVARARGDERGALAFAAECAGALLALAPEILDGIELGATRRGRVRMARFIARLREVLVPGRAATSHRRAGELRARVDQEGPQAVIPALRDAVARPTASSAHGDTSIMTRTSRRRA
jgi:hypothetical protein